MVAWRVRPALLGLAALLGAAGGGCREPTPAPSGERPPSLLLVTVDTLRADRVGAYGDALARTPTMDGLARDGVLFEAAYAAAPITLPSHATILTGLLPPAHGVRGNGSFALGPGPKTLAEVLAARGLRTGAFVAAFPLARRFGLARGFDRYDDAFTKSPGVHYDFADRRADAVVRAARDWLAGETGPVFLWVHLYDPHAPYDPPPAFRGPDPYRGEIAFVDDALGGLLAAWDSRPGPRLVALAADQDEGAAQSRVPPPARGARGPGGPRLAAHPALNATGLHSIFWI
jgi:hypothetical protein